MLSRLHYIDLFPEPNFEQSIENIIRSIDDKLVDTKIEPEIPSLPYPKNKHATEISVPKEIQMLKDIGFDMGEYRPITDALENIDSDTEFWSQSLWFGETPEMDFKLPNYTMAIVSGNKDGKLNEIRLILTINEYCYKDKAYKIFVEKCNQLCIILCKKELPYEIEKDLLKAKMLFDRNMRFATHTIYDDKLNNKGININMSNEYSNQSPLQEKPSRLRVHITKFNFTI